MSARTKLLATSELPVGSNRCLTTPAGVIALFHTEEGFFALDNECPHRGGPLSEGPIKDGHVACPWHQWLFDLKSGTCSNIPGAKVKSHPVEIIDGDVWLSHS